jgi:predicted nuclease of predicted toxin-antitoxin system
MAEVRFYADEHIPKAVIRGLRQRGVDILTVADAALIGAEDSTHLRRARGERRVIVTQTTISCGSRRVASPMRVLSMRRSTHRSVR